MSSIVLALPIADRPTSHAFSDPDGHLWSVVLG